MLAISQMESMIYTPQHVNNARQLVILACSWEERQSEEQLNGNATQ
jgi:hypothetical protein